jgi:hydroxymethylglutaryl-CoA reductase
MSADGFCWWTPEEIAEINRVAGPSEANFAKLRAQAFEAVTAAHREIHQAGAAQSAAQPSLSSNQSGRSRRAEVARNFLIELEDAIRTTRKNRSIP